MIHISMVSTIRGTTHSTLLIGAMQAIMTLIADIITTITIMAITLIMAAVYTNHIIRNQIGAIMWLVVMKMSVAMLIALHV